jgi:hypothetical protein
MSYCKQSTSEEKEISYQIHQMLIKRNKEEKKREREEA